MISFSEPVISTTTYNVVLISFSTTKAWYHLQILKIHGVVSMYLLNCLTEFIWYDIQFIPEWFVHSFLSHTHLDLYSYLGILP